MEFIQLDCMGLPVYPVPTAYFVSETPIPDTGSEPSARYGSNPLSPMQAFTLGVLERKTGVAKAEAPSRVFVGELHERWPFPSDHLPIGVQIGETRLASWNVLNGAFLDWVIEKDSQGLKGSIISELNVAVRPDGLTLRDLLVVKMIESMIGSSMDMVVLQECGEPFLNALQKRLPENWGMVKKSTDAVKDEEAVLYNQDAFAYRRDLSYVETPYLSAPAKTLLNAAFEREDGSIIRVLNVHIPGDPALPAKEEFARYVYEQSSSEEVLLALGDYNFEREEMLKAFREAGFASSETALHSPWPTNIDPYTKESKKIDHIFIQGCLGRPLKPEEMLPGYQLEEAISLLTAEDIGNCS